MFGSEILDVALGMAFLFGLLSLVASAIREGVEARLRMRAVHLERGIRELLSDEHGTGATSHIFDHPLIHGLFKGRYDPGQLVDSGIARWKRMPMASSLPTYIPSRNFALALLDIAANGAVQPGEDSRDEAADTAQPVTLASVRAGIARNLSGNPRLQRALLVAIDDAKGDFDRTRAALEAWFDSGMDRVSGWYKRQTQYILLAVGLLLAVVMNVDSIRVADELSTNNTLRAAVVASAKAEGQGFAAQAGQRAPGLDVAAAQADTERQATDPAADAKKADKEFETLRDNVKTLGLPIGWPGAFDSNNDGEWHPDWASSWNWPHVFMLIRTLLGWGITAFAVSLGAPFWFDVLNKIMVIRSTVKPHEKSGEESSEDRQSKPAQAAAAPGAKVVAAAVPVPAARVVTPDPEADFIPRQWAHRDDPFEGDA